MYLDETGLARVWAKAKSLFSREPITSGNWQWIIDKDDYFDAWYKAEHQTLTINNASGNLYRSALSSIALPSQIYNLGTVDIQHAEVNAAHNNYPAWGMLASFYDTGVNYYAMSGGSRNSSNNYTITCYIRGHISRS